MPTFLYWLNTSYACGGIFVKNKTVIKACPIYKWMKGKSLEYVVSYLKRKGTLIDCIKIGGNND